MQTIPLAAGALRAEIAPEAGGSLAAFWSPSAGKRVDWLRPATPEALNARDPLAMASFPLLPFCNRIRDGRAQFEGRDIAFPPNHPMVQSPHPLHGIGWQRPWTVLAGSERTAELALEVEAGPAWPWAFSARQSYELGDRRLAVELCITNHDTAPMPAGIGHHPYFPHLPGTRVQADTRAMWTGDHEVMPLALEAGDAVMRLRDGVELARLDLDNNFIGWGGTARIDWPADGLGGARHLVMHADAPLDYFVLYCPRGADHFCAEPVSQCTDWLNLMARYGPGPLGGQRLEPGQTLIARFSLTPGWD